MMLPMILFFSVLCGFVTMISLHIVNELELPFSKNKTKLVLVSSLLFHALSISLGSYLIFLNEDNTYLYLIATIVSGLGFVIEHSWFRNFIKSQKI